MSVPCGVSVIVFKDIEKDGHLFRRLLLGKRKGDRGEGQWGLPGGAIEPGELPVVCAARELEEETGLIASVDHLMVWWPCPFSNTFADTISGKEPWVTLFFWCVLSGEAEEVGLKEPDKCYEWGWFPLKRLPSPLFHAARACVRQSGW